MVIKKGKCYSKKDFEDYYNGKLESEEDKKIDEHVKICSTCLDLSLSIDLKPIRQAVDEVK